MPVLLSTAYFPPILYFKNIYNTKNIIIEINDNYTKQTYRNRTKILSANGVISLSFPVINTHNKKIKTKDIQIDYSTAWQKNHYKTILSAYKSSPFFDYYIDYFLPFFNKKYKFLIDFNTKILEQLFYAFDIKKNISFTNEYKHNTQNINDLREDFNTKKNHIQEKYCIKYRQVFSDRFDFTPNLSILDMLFNLGPESEIFLSKKPI